jgi:hypothetical protein
MRADGAGGMGGCLGRKIAVLSAALHRPIRVAPHEDRWRSRHRHGASAIGSGVGGGHGQTRPSINTLDQATASSC